MCQVFCCQTRDPTLQIFKAIIIMHIFKCPSDFVYLTYGCNPLQILNLSLTTHRQSSHLGATFIRRSALWSSVLKFDEVRTGHLAVYMSLGHMPKPVEPLDFASVCNSYVHMQGRSHCFVSDSVTHLYTRD